MLFHEDLLATLLGRGAELRFVPDLWSLRDDVISSTLRFSMIRMRNALPRRPTNPAPQPSPSGDAR
jgi:hypothetical protein